MASHQTAAFLGLGRLGRAMAARLIASGSCVALWNRSAEKSTALAGQAAAIHCTPASAAAAANLVCLCLTDAAAVEAVVFGPNGVAEGLSCDATVIDFSTIGVAHTCELAGRLSARTGASWLDCPVSGGVAGAQAGSLVVFAGGDAERLARARPLLDRLAARVTLFGPVGSGQAVKLCNQLIVSANLLAIAEAFRLGQALGLDVAKLPEALEGGFADSRPLQVFGPRMASPRDAADPVGSVATMAKDVAAVAEAAEDRRLDLPLAERVGELYREATSTGLAGEDLAALIRLRGGLELARESLHA